ncbi:hypothetical protein E3U43_016304 [Larimichthys crocea]|uniref:Uncharacterized protein n=1 Tax=Larimichthys crocea TaxID=215358 RepID=A0ACD3QHB9_LARCR|nr:hypothetical protein E3U43_016304 [Larimichthys crocea]
MIHSNKCSTSWGRLVLRERREIKANKEIEDSLLSVQDLQAALGGKASWGSHGPTVTWADLFKGPPGGRGRPGIPGHKGMKGDHGECQCTIVKLSRGSNWPCW